MYDRFIMATAALVLWIHNSHISTFDCICFFYFHCLFLSISTLFLLLFLHLPPFSTLLIPHEHVQTRAVPIDQTGVPTMYVFVEIGIDTQHLIDSIVANFPPSRCPRLVLAGTIQFATALQATRVALSQYEEKVNESKTEATDSSAAVSPTSTAASHVSHRYTEILVPQAKPLSAGEVLGCTAPRFADRAEKPDAIMYDLDRKC